MDKLDKLDESNIAWIESLNDVELSYFIGLMTGESKKRNKCESNGQERHLQEVHSGKEDTERFRQLHGANS